LSSQVLLIIAVLLRIVANPLANVFQKKLTSAAQPPLTVNFLSYLLLSGVAVFFAGYLHWAQLGATFWYYAVAAGVVGAMGNGFLVKAIEKGELSVLGPVNAYKSVIGLILAMLLLGEFPNGWGISGIILIVWGSYFVLDTTADRFSLALFQRSEIQFRIWALILTAIEAVLIKKIILLSDPVVAFVCWCWFGAVFSGFFLLVLGKKDRAVKFRPNSTQLILHLLLVVCIGTMQYTTNYAFKYINVGYALSLFQLSILISVLLGHQIFGETGIRQKLIGSAIMIAGSLLIILFK
jgi:drug/metabolite transporter (DMT)-like permease